MRKLAAAPVGPDTRPWPSFREASTMFFSCTKSLCGSSVWLFTSTERPSADSGLQVTVGCCDDSNVSADSTSAANTFKLMLLQNTQEGNLSLGRKFSDFVQEERTAIG